MRDMIVYCGLKCTENTGENVQNLICFCRSEQAYMITIFNRKELIVTTEMNRQAQVRDILSQNGIDYTVKTTNLQAAPMVGNSRGRVGSFGINQNYSYEYKIYVHKKDLEKAAYLIR